MQIKKVGIMGLFDKGKKQPTEQEQTLIEIDEQPAVNHNSVLDYMLELSDEDYDKLLKAAKIYREANRKVADIMGVDGVAAKAVDGEKIEVRVTKTDADDFIPTGNPQDMIDHESRERKKDNVKKVQ